jgi:hypothetical protein
LIETSVLGLVSQLWFTRKWAFLADLMDGWCETPVFHAIRPFTIIGLNQLRF